ncbi:putative coil containing protein [Vibrio phage 489E54-1]|nr:putative coil containing protein [Vibrio phage 489E54-1]
MGNITIKGVLKDPSAQIAVNVPVLIISKVGYGDTLVSSQVTRKTDATGSYDFPLVYGVHSVAVRFYDKFVTLGTVVVNSSSTAEMTINELLELSATEPPTPDWVVRIEQLTTEATAAANKAENEADRATAQVPLAEAQVTLAKNEVVKATAQADRAKSEADRATQVTGLDTVEQAVDHALAEFAGIMTESEARAIQATNLNHFDASGMVNMGGHKDASLTQNSVNEGIWTQETIPNIFQLGTDGVSDVGTSPTPYAVTHIAGAVTNLLGMNYASSPRMYLPEAEDGTRIYDSTGDCRGSGKASLDLKVDVDPKYGDVAADINEAVARAFEGYVRYGDFRSSDQWVVGQGTVISGGKADIPVSGYIGQDNHKLNLISGVNYRLTGVMLDHTNQGANDAVMMISATTSSSGTFASKTVSTNGVAELEFTAQSANNLIVFRGLWDSFSITPLTEEVVTHPVDLVALEYYEEELTGRQEIFECIQSLSTTFGTTSVPTVLSTRKLSYFQQYDGQFPEVTTNPDFINDRYRCVVWPDLTEPQKREIAAYMGEKLFMGVNGNIVNGRLRARTIRGLGNGDWVNISSNDSGTYDCLRYDNSNNNVVRAKGVKDAITEVGHINGGKYSSNGAIEDRGTLPVNKGVYTATDANRDADLSVAYQGRCFMYVVATVPRANKGAYVEGVNDFGTRKCRLIGTTDSAFWYEQPEFSTMTLKDCFTDPAGMPVGTAGYTIDSGYIGAPQGSGRPDGIYFDGIYAGGLNGVIDWRLGAVANDSPAEASKTLSKVENGTYRGLEQFLNVSMSGEFMFTYTETVGGSVELPRKCLTSTVECVHSSDGGATWTKTNPSVTGNSVTLPSGGKSVVSFKVSAKVAKPSTVKPVLNATKGLLGVTVTQSHDKAVLAEAVAGIILKSDASGIVTEQSQAVKYLVEDTIKRLKTLPTDMVAPTNGSQAIKIAVYQISNNGQTSLGIIANTMTHNGTDWGELEEIYIPSSGSESFTDSNGTSQQAIATELSIPTGWTSNHARPGPQVPGVDL